VRASEVIWLQSNQQQKNFGITLSLVGLTLNNGTGKRSKPNTKQGKTLCLVNQTILRSFASSIYRIGEPTVGFVQTLHQRAFGCLISDNTLALTQATSAFTGWVAHFAFHRDCPRALVAYVIHDRN